jgi:hypothetical protein
MPHEHPAVQKSQLPAHRAVEIRTEYFFEKIKVLGTGPSAHCKNTQQVDYNTS